MMTKHTILFLAANPLDTDRLALDKEARAIQIELERSGHRDRFELATRWAVEPLDLLRELRRLKPTVVHFSGHGGASAPGGPRTAQAPTRDVVVGSGRDGAEPQGGLFFQGPDGRAKWVSAQALRDTFGAAGASVQVIVLNACYSASQAEALRAHVDCVVGMSSAILDDAARCFAIGFYGGLGERESVAAAYRQGCAAIGLQGLPDADRPQLAVRAGVDAEQLVLAADRFARAPAESDAPDASNEVGRRATETAQAGRGRAASHVTPGVTHWTREDLLTRLSQLLPAQFEEVMFRAKVPTAHLSGPSAPQATRAIEALRHLEHQHRLDQLAQILDAVAGAS
ncbi:MAG TPA: CHAT domain-containing protein [Kofleriaceae bacterium]|nr:CHAT domain-containing protein [Kofleriaceae bacterium]